MKKSNQKQGVTSQLTLFLFETVYLKFIWNSKSRLFSWIFDFVGKNENNSF